METQKLEQGYGLSESHLTGAEVAAAVLSAAGTSVVFAYAGTSELALCAAVDRTANVRLINGRGDKESAFMAAGAGMLEPGLGAAILHGARGLTNATGALADSRRNEVGVVYLVGLPSTGSAKFLPPHGEHDLMATIGEFAGWWWEAPEIPDSEEAIEEAARTFVASLWQACNTVRKPPHQPAMIGIPQDVAERRWVPPRVVSNPPPTTRLREFDHDVTYAVARALAIASNPVVLIDDYALRYEGMRAALDSVSFTAGAPVFQARYRRGPMLFERLQSTEVRNFVGWLNPYSIEHRRLLARADLLITVEDRNLYQRVVGDLPTCPAIAITSDPSKAWKNGYLNPGSLVLKGHPVDALKAVTAKLEQSAVCRDRWFDKAEIAGGARTAPESADHLVTFARRSIASALGEVLRDWKRPVIVDDSQMFGGLLSEYYEELPPGLRVFGGHGGFVGGGLGYATGLAIANPDVRVLCSLGDHAFTNSFQGLVAAMQEQPCITYLVCNNGRSVSLTKQASATEATWPDDGQHRYLQNVEGFDYVAVASSLGIWSSKVEVPIGASVASVEEAVGSLSGVLKDAMAADGPALVELKVPEDAAAWRGIWINHGFEEKVKL